MQALPITERDVRIMIACTHTFLSFFAQNRSVYMGDAVFPGPINAPVSSSFTVNDDVTVTLTTSYDTIASVLEEDDDFFEDDFFEPVPPPAPRVGRNDPCPCGSGKKYKKCHLDADQEPRRAISQADTVHEMDARLALTMARFASTRFGPDWLAVDRDQDIDSLAILLPWSTWTAVVGATSVAEAFVEANERRLSPDERDWCAAQQMASPSIWEVTKVRPGVIDVRDLLTGQTRSVSEERIWGKLIVQDTLLTRVIDYHDRSYFSGTHRCPLTPGEAAIVVDAVRTNLRLSNTPVPMEDLRNPTTGLFMIEQWSNVSNAGQEPEH